MIACILTRSKVSDTFDFKVKKEHYNPIFSLQLTTPRCTGHFIIHPDWVSEKGGIRRSKSFIQMKKDGLRY